MTRICLIGNSHLAALKHGAEVLGPIDGVSLEFYGCAGRIFKEFDVDGGFVTPRQEVTRRLWQQTSMGHERIELDRFDQFVIVGFAGPNLANKLVTRYVTHDMGDAARRKLVSTALWVELVRHEARREVGVWLASAIARETGRPVKLVPSPRRARAILAVSKQMMRLHASGDAERVCRLYDIACDRLAPGIEMMRQPTVTVVDHLFTNDEFNEGTLGLVAGYEQPPFDSSHMNPLYGAICLRELLLPLGSAVAIDLRVAAEDQRTRRVDRATCRSAGNSPEAEQRQLARARNPALRLASSGSVDEAELRTQRREARIAIERRRIDRAQARAEQQAEQTREASEAQHRRALREGRSAARAVRLAAKEQRRRAHNAVEIEAAPAVATTDDRSTA